MKHSIDKIFKNLNIILLILLSLAIIGFFFLIEQYYSYKKIDNLNNQATVISLLLNEQKKSNDIDILQFNHKMAQINNEIKKLLNQHKYNYISNILTDNSSEYIADINKLNSLIDTYNKSSREYFKLDSNNKNMQLYYNNLKSTHYSISKLINTIMIKNISYDSYRFDIFSKIFALLLITLFLSTFWYKNRLSNIYNDIMFLYSTDSKKSNVEFFSQEADAIALRMKRKTNISDNPTMIDPVTEINNHKGMLQSYSEKKGLKDNNFKAVAVLEIDNFSKSQRAFSQELTQEILKKVAYTISLHEQVTDTIARTDYNQFTLIFSRQSKEQLFKDIDLVRQSISDIELMTPQNETINITATGSFIIKPNNSPLEDSIRKAKELLENAKGIGTNKILQIKDLPQ